MRIWCAAVVLLLVSYPAMAKGINESELIRLSRILDRAVVAVMDWGEMPEDGGVAKDGPPPGVVGSAFFINDDGYFVTADHVLQHYKAGTARVTVIFRQPDDGGSGQWFDVVERDSVRDIALCRVANFDGIKRIPADKFGFHLPASLVVTAKSIVVGASVVIAGFPLGSWNPSVQAGHVAALKTINPSVGGARGLFQVSVAGNQGDSGGPVVDLHSGAVMGVVVRGSMLVTKVGPETIIQSSGIMMAAPATWIQELLAKHDIKSAASFPPN